MTHPPTVTPPTLIPEKCIGCLACVSVCSKGVLEQGPDGKTVIAHPEKCTGCDECVYVCATEALLRKK